MLPQSQAIVRHLARKLNLYGENLREHALADVVSETVQDIRAKFVSVAFAARMGSTPETIEKYWSEVLPHSLALLEKLLSRIP